MQYVGATDNGKVRSANEDSFLAFYCDNVFYGVVADGMGGHNAGEVASNEAIIAFKKSICENTALPIPEKLVTAIKEANTRLFKMTIDNPALVGMGTTLTACAVFDGIAWFANVGDSRGYHITESIKQITKDHSLVQELIDAGDITLEDSKVHPQRNVITRAIGTTPVVLVDVFETPFLPGETVLLCSDGLTNTVADSKILRIVQKERNIEAIASKLIAEANEAGGHDNITALIIRAEEEAQVK